MSKYFTLCEFTPSFTKGFSKNQWHRVYPKPVQGILFHDTQGELPVTRITRALFKLSGLTKETGPAIAIRVNPQTIVTTFSTSGFPHPVRPSTSFRQENSEWLHASNLHGWLIRDVCDPTSAPTDVTFNDIYETCPSLMRLTGMCPCEKLRDGTCFKEVVLPHIPLGFNKLTDYTLNTDMFRRVKYKTVAGFSYTSSAHTTREDFLDGLRPWDYHDFSFVEERRAELSERGKARHRRATFRKEECVNCAFSTKLTNATQDCGDIRNCKESVNSAAAWTVLYDWYASSGFANMPGFTADERNYLITLGTRRSLAKAFRASRRLRVVHGGFKLHASPPGRYGERQWGYSLVAGARNFQRKQLFTSYSDLREVLPELPTSVPKTYIAPKELLGYAIAGTCLYIANRPLYSTQLTQKRVSITSASTHYVYTCISLNTYDEKNVYQQLFGYTFGSAAEKYKDITHSA